MPKALQAAPRGSRPQNAPTTNRARGVGLARREDVGNRKATPLLSSVGNARISGESETVDTIHAEKSGSSGRNLSREDKTGVGRKTRKNSDKKRGDPQAAQQRNRANAGDSGGEEAAAGRKSKNPRCSEMRPLQTKNEKASRGFGEALEGHWT